MGNLGLMLVLQSALAIAPATGCVLQGDLAIDGGRQMTVVSQTDQIVKNQLLVRFDDSLSVIQIDEIIKRLGTTVINRMSDGKLVLVEVPYDNLLAQIQAAYEATPGVKYAEPNQVYQTQPDNAAPPEADVIELPKVSN